MVARAMIANITAKLKHNGLPNQSRHQDLLILQNGGTEKPVDQTAEIFQTIVNKVQWL